MTTYKKKLIEVALPLPEINDASAYDKMPGIGPHPKGIHQWWSRKPLPTARAVLFASIVDDPSEHPEKWPTEETQNVERERLFNIIRRMMIKKLHKHPEAYADALVEMRKHCNNRLPIFFDPFAGGGSIPLEAKRMGFESFAGDLNPVAVLLNKINLELIPKWFGRRPVNPEDRNWIGRSQSWNGANGIAADLRYYGRLIKDRAILELGHLYPPIKVTSEMAVGREDLKPHIGKELPVIAWIWARTVASPNPAAQGKHVPLISTYWLCNKKGKEAWLEPVINNNEGTYRFEVRRGPPKNPSEISAGTKEKKGGFRCLLTNVPIPFEYIRNEGQSGRLGNSLIAVVVEIPRGRNYVPIIPNQIEAANIAKPKAYPDTDLPNEALGFRVQNYGIRKHWQMFNSRQLTTMVMLSDLLRNVGADIRRDCTETGFEANEAKQYSETLLTFLALALDRCADFNNAFCTWSPSNQKVMHLFGQQIIRMGWEFAEANFLGTSVGGWATCNEYVADCIETIIAEKSKPGHAYQIDAATGADSLHDLLVSTDPPYYDNIGYAALSDFFYVWLRRTIGNLYPDIFNTVLVPKITELTAAPENFGGDKKKAKEHFKNGFQNAFTALRTRMDPRFPLSVYYAFKQDDEDTGSDDKTAESNTLLNLTTGWETLLDALISSGFQITATWPVRSEQKWRMRAMGANALASCIVITCRSRAPDVGQTDRRSFVTELKRELPTALRHLQQGNIAPVDFAQAAIGPGMAIYSRYSSILETNGKPMSVRVALGLINQTLTEVLSEQEDEFDSDTRWALSWFEQHGYLEGDFGDAEILSKAKVTSIAGLEQAGIIASRGGKVRLLRPDELPKEWDPSTDKRTPMWEATHHLLRIYYYEKAGDAATGVFLRKLRLHGDQPRDLAYRLFDLCEKKKWSQEAQAYNALVLGWPEIARLAREDVKPHRPQTELFDQE